MAKILARADRVIRVNETNTRNLRLDRSQNGQPFLHYFESDAVAGKYRNAVIDKVWKGRLLVVIGNLINETNCKTIIVNGVEDHVHCFFGLKSVISVSELMKAVKAKSSKYINEHKLTPERFEWQEGYGVFSYSQSGVDAVYKYIPESGSTS